MIKLETKCVRIKIKDGMLPRVTEWASALNARSAEVLETLRNEGVYFEAAFLEETSEGHYLIYVMKAKSFEEARRIADQSELSIDHYHREFIKDCWGERSRPSLLIDFDRFSELSDVQQ